MYKSKEYVNWLQLSQVDWLQQKRSNKIHRIEGEYSLFIVFCAPDNRRRDIDNTLKPLNDFLQAANIVEDDRYCRRILIRYGSKEEAPSGVRVMLRGLAKEKKPDDK